MTGLGDKAFRKELLERVHTCAKKSHHAGMRRETTVAKARRLLNEELDKLGWNAAELARQAKGDARKIRIAQRLRTETAVTLKWIAAELYMGTWTHVAKRLQIAKALNESNNHNELGPV